MYVSDQHTAVMHNMGDIVVQLNCESTRAASTCDLSWFHIYMLEPCICCDYKLCAHNSMCLDVHTLQLAQLEPQGWCTCLLAPLGLTHCEPWKLTSTTDFNKTEVSKGKVQRIDKHSMLAAIRVPQYKCRFTLPRLTRLLETHDHWPRWLQCPILI